MTNHGWFYQEISSRFWVKRTGEAEEIKLPEHGKILDLTFTPIIDNKIEPKTTLKRGEAMLSYFDEKCEKVHILFDVQAYLIKENGKTVETL